MWPKLNEINLAGIQVWSIRAQEYTIQFDLSSFDGTKLWLNRFRSVLKSDQRATLLAGVSVVRYHFIYKQLGHNFNYIGQLNINKTSLIFKVITEMLRVIID